MFMQSGLVIAKPRQPRAASQARVTGEERAARMHIKASSAQSMGSTGLAREFSHPQPRIWQPENQIADGSSVPWGRDGAGPSILVEGFVFQRQHYNESFISNNAPLVASVASQRPPSTPWPDPILDERWLAVRLRHMPSARAAKLCTAAKTINGTALFVYRDHPNFFHTVLLQMLPAYWILKAYGLEHQNFTMIYLDYESYNHIFYARDARVPLEAEMAQLAGGRPGKTLAAMPDIFCAQRAVLGGPDFTQLFFHPLTPAERRKNMPVVVSYVDWYLSRHGLAREAHSHGGQKVPRVAILPRKLGAQRSLYNPGAWLAAARARGWQVEVRDYDGLPMSAQLQLDLATSIFIMPHGAGCTHAAFMQHGSVFVELVAHGVVEHSSFYHGYANVAQLADVSFLKYHDVNKTLAPPRGFHCDSVIFLSEGEIGAVLDEAFRVWQQQQQLQPRVRPALINMNEPAVFDCGWG